MIGITSKSNDNHILEEYDSIKLAMLLYPLHGTVNTLKLWQLDTGKEGKKQELLMLEFPLEEKIDLAVGWSITIYERYKYIDWAKAWLKGERKMGSEISAITETNIFHIFREVVHAVKTFLELKEITKYDSILHRTEHIDHTIACIAKNILEADKDFKLI